MKRLLSAFFIMALMLICTAALAQPPLPGAGLILKKKLIITDDLSNNQSYINWLIKNKLAPNEYFALAFLEDLPAAKPAVIAVTYSEDGQQWSAPTKIPLKGKSSGALKGVDLTHHKWGILQGFAYDFNTAELDRLFGMKLATGLKINPASPGFPVANVGPPATIIIPSGYQFLVCNIQGKLNVFKSKVDAAGAFPSMNIPKSCDTKIGGRPDIAFKKNKLLIAWLVPGKGIWTALYGISPLGKLEFIKCKLALVSGAVQPGTDQQYEIQSAPVLAACDETFYIGVSAKLKGEPAAKFRIFRSADAGNWTLKHTLKGASSKVCKLGLAAKIDGGLLAAVVEKTAAGVKASSWLYHRDKQMNWQWTSLGDKPWSKLKPALKEFGADSGGVRR